MLVRGTSSSARMSSPAVVARPGNHARCKNPGITQVNRVGMLCPNILIIQITRTSMARRLLHREAVMARATRGSDPKTTDPEFSSKLRDVVNYVQGLLFQFTHTCTKFTGHAARVKANKSFQAVQHNRRHRHGDSLQLRHLEAFRQPLT